MGVKIYRERVEPLPAVKDNTEQDSIDVFQSFKGELEETEAGKNKLEVQIELNSATRRDLEEIPGIGPVTADRIVVYRETNGLFRSVNDLEKVKGIGRKTVLKITPYLIIK